MLVELPEGQPVAKRRATEAEITQVGQRASSSLEDSRIANLRLQLQLAEAHKLLGKKQQ